MKKVLKQVEQVDLIVNELNSLDFSDKNEDSLYLENLNRLDEIYNDLCGDITAPKTKTSKFLQ